MFPIPTQDLLPFHFNLQTPRFIFFQKCLLHFYHLWTPNFKCPQLAVTLFSFSFRAPLYYSFPRSCARRGLQRRRLTPLHFLFNLSAAHLLTVHQPPLIPFFPFLFPSCVISLQVTNHLGENILFFPLLR